MTPQIVRLPNDIPFEAVTQMGRHLLQIRKEAGYNNTIVKTDVNIVPEDIPNSGLSSNRTLVVNINWDYGRCLDAERENRTNGLTTWVSNLFLNCYLWTDIDGKPQPQLARSRFQGDFMRYFYDPAFNRYMLPNPNGQRTIREFFVEDENIVLNFQDLPIIQYDIQLKAHWAALRNDLKTPA